MAGHLKSSSENNLSLHGEIVSFERPTVNFSFRKLPRRSNSMPSVMADNMSAQMKQFIAEINSGVDKLKDTLLVPKESPGKHFTESFRNEDMSYEIIQQDQTPVVDPYFSRKMSFPDTENEVDSVTDMSISIDALLDPDLRPHSLNKKDFSKRDPLSDIQFQIDRNNWFCDKEILISQIEKAKIDYRENLINEYNAMKKDLEYEITTLRGENRSLEQELKQCRDIEKLRSEENRKIFEEHQKELQRLKKDGLQDSKKQFSEMKHLHNIIEKLEKKLGFEAGFCLHLQPGKSELDEALSRVKLTDSWDMKDCGEHIAAKGKDSEKIEFDMNSLVNELPGRLAAKPHNDPERILHRKIVELSSLIRKLDEKNQQLAIRNEEILQELELAKDGDKQLEDRTAHLGAKNMELVHQLRKLEGQVKDLQQSDSEKEERIVQLQELVEKKDKKMRNNKRKMLTQQQMDEYEDLQRQSKEQLQIIAELRQLTLEKERRIDVLKNRHRNDRHRNSSAPTRSVSLDSLNFNFEELPLDLEPLHEDNKINDIMEPIESNKQKLSRLTKEHLELQHAYALLQQHVGEIKDPQRSQLNRESLQSDLLVSQATINELEAQLEDKDKTIGRSVQEYQSKAGMVQTMEEKNVGLHQKLVDAESHLMEKTLLLKKLTEEMKEVMDQNDLMEFRITEMENVIKPKTNPTLLTPEEDKCDLRATDLNEGDCNAISVRIALKELEINKQYNLTPSEKRSLVQARAYVDKTDKELTTLKKNERILKTKLEDITNKYNQTQSSLVEQGNELTQFRRETTKNEEHELTKVDMTGKASTFDKMMLDIEESPAKLLSEAKNRIQELERTNEFLLKKMESFDGNKINLSDEEIGLLYHKVDQLRDAEKQINFLKISNDDLLNRIRKFEINETMQSYNQMSQSSDYGSLPDTLAEEISKLKKENEELNSEMGTLRLRADDALAIAQKTKDVLNKEDQGTQTPSEESFNFFLNNESKRPKKIDASIQTIFNMEYVQKSQDIVVASVLKHTDNIAYDFTKDVEPPKTLVTEDIANLDECQLQEDNEFIQSVLRGLDDNDRAVKVFHSSSIADVNKSEEHVTSDQSSSSFTDYLKKKNDFGVQVGSNETSSNATSLRSSLDVLNEDHTGFCHVDDVSSKSSNSKFLSTGVNVDLGSGSASTHTSGTALNDNDSRLINRRLPSACSTCGVTPPLLYHKHREHPTSETHQSNSSSGSYKPHVLSPLNISRNYTSGVSSELSKEKPFKCICATCGSNTPSDVPDISTGSMFEVKTLHINDSPVSTPVITRCPTCGVNPSHIVDNPTNLDCLTCGLIQSYQQKNASSSSSICELIPRINDTPITSEYEKYDTNPSIDNDKSFTPACLNCGMTPPLHPHIPSNICSICGFTNPQTEPNRSLDIVKHSHTDMHLDLHRISPIITNVYVSKSLPNGSDIFTQVTTHVPSQDSGTCVVTSPVIGDLTSVYKGLSDTNTVGTYQDYLSAVSISSPCSQTEKRSIKSPSLQLSNLLEGSLQIVSPRAIAIEESKYEVDTKSYSYDILSKGDSYNSLVNVDPEVERLLNYGKCLQSKEYPIKTQEYKDEPIRLPEFTADPMRVQNEGHTSTVSIDSIKSTYVRQKFETDEQSISTHSSNTLTLPTVTEGSRHSQGLAMLHDTGITYRSSKGRYETNMGAFVSTTRTNVDQYERLSNPSYSSIHSGDTCKLATQFTSSIPIHASSSYQYSHADSAESVTVDSKNYASCTSGTHFRNIHSTSIGINEYKPVNRLLEGGSVDLPLQTSADGALDGTLVGVKDLSTMSEDLKCEDSISIQEVKEDFHQTSLDRRNSHPLPIQQNLKSYQDTKSEGTSYLDIDRSSYSSRLKKYKWNEDDNSPRIQPCLPLNMKLSYLPSPGNRRSSDYSQYSKSLPDDDVTIGKDSIFGLASSKYKFPSDSELSKQSGSSSDAESNILIDTRYRQRKLPTPTVLRNRKLRSPLRSPVRSPTAIQNEYDYKRKRVRINELSQKDYDENSQISCQGNSTSNLLEFRLSKYKLSDVPSLVREIMFLRQECGSLERQLQNRETVVRAMQDELKEESENMAILEQKDKEINLKSESISQITQLLQKTKKELEHKSSECNRRETEIKHIRDELKAISDEKKVLEHTLSEQQLKIIKLESAETRLNQMTEKYDQLLGENRELVERIKNLEINEKEFIDLERNVIELQTQLHDMEDIELHRDELLVKLQDVKKQRDEFLEKGKMVEEERNEFVRSNKTLEQYILEWKRKTTEFKKTNQALKDRILSCEKDKKELETRIQDIQAERTSMQTIMNKLEGERDDYLREMREMKLDRNAMEAKITDLEEAMYDYDHLEEGFHSLRLKLAELTRQRDDTELLIPSYKAKVKVLKKTVREKEESIMQLSHEIKTMKVIMENFTYDDLSHFKSISGVTSDSSHTNPRSTYSKKYRPSDMNMTSESETYDLLMSRPQPAHAEFSDDSESFTKEERKRNSANRRKGRKYVALFDYDPYKSSTARHPERELRLKEGDDVTVYGKMDMDGYMEAEVSGARGLVPSIYLEEISEEEATHNIRYSTIKTLRTGRERHMIALYDYDPYTMGTTDRPELQLSLRKGDLVKIYGTVNTDGYYVAVLNGKEGLVPSNFVEEHSTNNFYINGHNGQLKSTSRLCDSGPVLGPPFAPRDLKVIRVVTKNAVLLGWQLPTMDDQERSNGCRVTGYKIWVNGKLKQEVNSAKMTKAFVDDIDLHGRVEFSIQTMGEEGLYSEKCHFAITGALSTLTTNTDNTDSKSNLYVALYDYDPQKSSPNPNPTLEVSFQEGDLIKVFDTTRSDGFYGAEVNGRKGLVPSNFIEKVTNAEGSSTFQHSPKINNLDSDSRRVSFKSKEV